LIKFLFILITFLIIRRLLTERSRVSVKWACLQLQDTGTHDEVDEGEEEEQHHDADGHVSFAPPQARLVEAFLFDGHVARLEVTVVFLVDAAALHGLLTHRLLHGTVGALLQEKTISEA